MKKNDFISSKFFDNAIKIVIELVNVDFKRFIEFFPPLRNLKMLRQLVFRF